MHFTNISLGRLFQTDECHKQNHRFSDFGQGFSYFFYFFFAKSKWDENKGVSMLAFYRLMKCHHQVLQDKSSCLMSWPGSQAGIAWLVSLSQTPHILSLVLQGSSDQFYCEQPTGDKLLMRQNGNLVLSTDGMLGQLSEENALLSGDGDDSQVI